MMIGKKSRKINNLEIRGISRELENHPLPDQIDEVASHVTALTRYSDVVSNYADPPFSIPTAAVSGRSSPSRITESDSSQNWTETGEVWYNGGANTERSSEFSLEDEFDRNTSLEVRRLFEEIDSMLFERHYESTSGKAHPLQGECKEWLSQFPHERIVGRQMVTPQDLGFEVIPGHESLHYNSGALLDVTEQDITQTHTFNELTVSGQHVNAKQPSLQSVKSSQDADCGDYVTEEIFAEDGHIEDIIAVDFTSTDEDVRSSYTRPRYHRKGLPPMTPQACIKDNLHGAIFDVIWKEVITWLRPLNNKFVQSCMADSIISAADEVRGVRSEPPQAIHSMLPPHIHNFTNHPIAINEDDEDCSTPRGQQRSTVGQLTQQLLNEPSFVSEFVFPATTSREASTLSTTRDNKLRTVASNTQLVGGQMKPDSIKDKDLNIEGLLTAKKKTIFNRLDKSTFSSFQDSTEFIPSSFRPTSSQTKLISHSHMVRPGSVNKEAMGRNSSAQAGRGRTGTKPYQARLQPLEGRRGTPNVEDDTTRGLQNEVLHGRKISTPSDHHLMNIERMVKNSALPPIYSSNVMDRETSDVTHRVKTAGSSSNRASSAVNHDREPRMAFPRELSMKEKPHVQMQIENRPSTTQAFNNNDSTSLFNGRRSQTPMSQNPINRHPAGSGAATGSNLHPSQMKRSSRPLGNTAVR